MPHVKLKLGNLFDEPCDLVVLPCSTAGTISGFVEQHLRNLDILYPKARMTLGQVDIQPLVGGENIAQFAAFAASVANMVSDEEAIREIGECLGEATREYQSIERISAPLLGSGAGGLKSDAIVDALSSGFKATAAQDAVLTIFVLRREAFDKLQGQPKPKHAPAKSKRARKPATKTSHVPTRVFVSYSGTSPDHKEWVAKLATHLRQNGVDARLDQWHLRGGMDLPQWMTNELQLADRVIIVTDSRYTDRANGRVGGVGWETMLIQGDMLTRSMSDSRYIVIVREEDFESGVPIFLKTKYCLHWEPGAQESELRTTLLKEIYDVPKAPEIGPPPVFV